LKQLFIIIAVSSYKWWLLSLHRGPG